ncbi:MAG: VOC family protein, partial [Solirubrobacterales bacterium]|nr:VOC family protein [Solirubrobacterales bacterium]
MTEHQDQATPISGASPDAPRVENRTMPPCTLIPELAYDDVIEAIDWLCDRFGFVERWRVGDHRAQLSFGTCTVAITEPRTSNVRPGPRDVMVRIADVAAHHERARDRGVRVIREPRDFPYGERQYTAEDLGGHRWTFSESIADVSPEDWGGTSGPALLGDRSPPPAAASEFSGQGPVISVMLIVPDADAAIDWYTRALGAQVLW